MAKSRKKTSTKAPVDDPVVDADIAVSDLPDEEVESSGGKRTGRKLVVVESPAKAKTINRYLGKEYIVKASMGHVRDLPSKNIGVDVDNRFEPSYEPLASRKKVLTELKKYASTASEVFLATDLDREGEAIAWHLAESLGVPADRIRRVVFNEITKNAIQEAFAHPRAIEMTKVNAQQARRILDRIVGYQISPLLWRKVAAGLSAGRVQSVAVRLIVEREREIDAFIPEEYWKVSAVFTADLSRAAALGAEYDNFLKQMDERGNPPTRDAESEFLSQRKMFTAELASWKGQKFKSDQGDEVIEVAKALGLIVKEVRRTEDEKGKGPARNRVTVIGSVFPDAGAKASRPRFVVSNMGQRESRSRPPAPFTTASMQQAASVQLRFGAQRTMRIAQQLYEGVEIPGEGSVGLITYMRTDSTHIAAEALGQVRSLIGQEFGPQYVPEKPNVYSSSQRAQEAHEAVRPTDAGRAPQSLLSALTDEQYKLYDLIWKRFVASQMPPAVWNVTEADITAATPSGEAVFKAVGRQLQFDGFYRVAGVPKGGDQILPALAVQQEIAPVNIDPSQHFTQPPPRFTEASLVKAMEAEGIGRPSTYANIIQTIQDRQYVEQLERSLHPTHLGCVVTDKLVKHFPKEFDVRFTAHMENELDKIEDTNYDWVKVLEEFYGPFKDNLKLASEEMVHAKAETEPSEYVCETCGKPMVYRFSKTGRYLACTGYPDCKTTCPVDEEGKKVQKQTVEVACPKCGEQMTLRRGRFGPFLSCSAYPDCNGIVKMDRKGCVALPSAPPLEVELPCPKCQAPLYLRRSKRGPWLSCSKYPKCRGRQAWSVLDKEKQAELEQRLQAHEQANPVAILKTVSGETIGAGYNPVDPTASPSGTGGARPAGVNCPKCSKEMVIRTGKRGDFLACTGYPKCRNAMSMDSLEELKAQQQNG